MYEVKRNIASGMIRPATARRLDGYTARQSTSLARIQHSRKNPYAMLAATAVQKTAEFNAGIAKVNTTGKLHASAHRANSASLVVSPPFSAPLASRWLGLRYAGSPSIAEANSSSVPVMRVILH